MKLFNMKKIIIFYSAIATAMFIGLDGLGAQLYLIFSLWTRALICLKIVVHLGEVYNFNIAN